MVERDYSIREKNRDNGLNHVKKLVQKHKAGTASGGKQNNR